MKCHNCKQKFKEKDMYELKEPRGSCIHCHSDLYEENVFCHADCVIEHLHKKMPIGSPPLQPEDISPKEMLKEDEWEDSRLKDRIIGKEGAK